ncbi:MAG: DUF6308 family protein [Streptosporangiaceae bacterium]
MALYFDHAQPFAGLTFDVLGRNPPHEISSDNLLAVTLLNVRWPPLAVRTLRGTAMTEDAGRGGAGQ